MNLKHPVSHQPAPHDLDVISRTVSAKSPVFTHFSIKKLISIHLPSHFDFCSDFLSPTIKKGSFFKDLLLRLWARLWPFGGDALSSPSPPYARSISHPQHQQQQHQRAAGIPSFLAAGGQQQTLPWASSPSPVVLNASYSSPHYQGR